MVWSLCGLDNGRAHEDAVDTARGDDSASIARDILIEEHGKADTCDAPDWADYQQYVHELNGIMGDTAFDGGLEQFRAASGHTWCAKCARLIAVGYFEFNPEAIGVDCDCGGVMAEFIMDMVVDYLVAQQLTGPRVHRLPVGCHV